MGNSGFLRGRIFDAVRVAGEKALRCYREYLNGKGSYSYKHDGTFLTRVDLVLEDFIRERVCSTVNEIDSTVAIFGEERGWIGLDFQEAEYVVLIDPIEGTALFLSPLELPIWGIAISIFKNSHMLMSWFHMPAIDQIFFAESGRGATLNGRKLRITCRPISDTSYMGISSDGHKWDLSTFPGKVRAFGSTGFHVASVVTGFLDSALLTHFHNYDLSALALIAKESGAELVYYPSGQPVKFSDLLRVRDSSPILICHPDQVDSFLRMSLQKRIHH